MDWLQIFGYTAGVVSVLGIIPYLRDIFRGTTKPERASWFIWSVLGSIAFFSQYAKGATDSLWMTGAQTLIVIVVFLLAIRYGMGGFARRDIFALFAAAAGLVLWYFTQEAAIALFIVIFIDAIGSLLTAIKSYTAPHTETLITWLFAGAAGLFGMLAVGELNWILLAYPFYIFAANTIIAFAIMLGKQKRHT